jgi:hypothetical protein
MARFTVAIDRRQTGGDKMGTIKGDELVPLLPPL